MNEKPGYKCFISQSNGISASTVIERHSYDTVTYFHDTTKIHIRILFIIATFLVLSLPFFLQPFLGDVSFWTGWIAYIIAPLLLILGRFIFTFWYPLYSFRVITPEEAVLFRKKKLSRVLAGIIVTYILMPALLVVVCFSANYASVYIRYTADIASGSSSVAPAAEANFDFSQGSGHLDTTHSSVKGYLHVVNGRSSCTVYAVNGSQDITVLFNGVNIRQYKNAHSSFSQSIYFRPFSHLYYFYDIPASLFKAVNTLHVEGGHAWWDWTIILTDMYGNDL